MARISTSFHTKPRAWTVNGLTPSQDVAADTITVTGFLKADSIYFSNDGTKMIMTESLNDKIGQISITAWTPDNSAVSYFTDATRITAPEDAIFSYDGNFLFVANNKMLLKYSLGAAWDISTGVTFHSQLDLSSDITTGYMRNLYFSNDGTKCYVATATKKTVIEYTASTAWDLTTFTKSNELIFTDISYASSVNYVFLSPDGRTMFVGVNSQNAMFQMNLETAFSLASASTNLHKKIKFNSSGRGSGIYIRPDGSVLYTSKDSTTRKVYEYNLT